MATAIKTPAGAIEAGRFSWNSVTRTFCAEASDLPADRVGETVTIFNPATGGLAKFKCLGTDRDGEGDVTCWRYVCAPLRLKLTIFND